jgi:hypothetical protein
MKPVIIICLSLITCMAVITGVSYRKYKLTETKEVQTNSPAADLNSAVEIDSMPKWCNDKEYVDTVVIPLQEDIYNVEIQQENYETEEIKQAICKDSQSCGIHETLYDKSIDARNFNIQLIKLDKKLDSLNPH